MAIDPALHVRHASPTLTALRFANALRWLAAAGYVAFFVQQYRSSGFPFDRERVLAWVGAALLITGIGKGWRHVGRIVTDWLPFAALLIAYDYSRGAADDLGVAVHVDSLVNVEKFLFFGHVPAASVQHHFMPAADTPVAWWEFAVSVVYASHFVLPFALAGVLWWRSRDRWRAFTNRFLLLSFGAVVTYCVLPTAPPWFAADEGLIAALDRPVGRGWAKVGLFGAPTLLAKGRAALNPFAALPSLHAGYSFLIAAFLWTAIGRGRARHLLFLYPLAMALTLVYGGEHYVIDIVAGWLAALAAMAGATRLERYVRARG